MCYNFSLTFICTQNYLIKLKNVLQTLGRKSQFSNFYFSECFLYHDYSFSLIFSLNYEIFPFWCFHGFIWSGISKDYMLE